jgi:hypothetical protein
MTDFAFLQLVLAKSQSVEHAAARYGCQPAHNSLLVPAGLHRWRQSQAKEA